MVKDGADLHGLQTMKLKNFKMRNGSLLDVVWLCSAFGSAVVVSHFYLIYVYKFNLV